MKVISGEDAAQSEVEEVTKSMTLCSGSGKYGKEVLFPTEESGSRKTNWARK